jgi:hypothetical protein
MMDESELRRRFAQLRETDLEHAPSFAQTSQTRHGRRQRPLSWRAMLRAHPILIGAAAAVLIAAIWQEYARSFLPPPTAPEIATWRAPTDVLLRTPGSVLLGEMPALGASVLDTMIPKPSSRGT